LSFSNKTPIVFLLILTISEYADGDLSLFVAPEYASFGIFLT